MHAIDQGALSCEIGYWCATRDQHQGLITEAVQALSDYALSSLGLRQVVSWIDPHNMASRRVAEKSGYQHEGVQDGMCVYLRHRNLNYK